MLEFDEEHKRGLVVLQRFFAIGVEWPWLVPVIRRLMMLPDNRLFWLLNKLWKGWAIKNRVHPIKLGFREIGETVWHFMRIKS